jgi:pentose-5-phosphate-3-epimerase
MQIIPAILPHNFEEIEEKCSRVEELVPLVQIDICDGVFGRERTWIPSGTDTLPGGFLYEFDIMVNDWKPVLEGALSLSAARVVMHMDLFSDEDVGALVDMVSLHAIPLGVSVSNDKSVDALPKRVSAGHGYQECG